MNSDARIRCTNCKCWREPASYVGKRGDVVKRCVKCREKDARQKKRPDVILKRNERYKQKRYDIAWREKKRNEDEAAFLRRNADTHRHWLRRNKEKVYAYQRNNWNVKLYTMKYSARTRKISWNIDDKLANDLVCGDCFYCGIAPLESFNGIDRVDNG